MPTGLIVKVNNFGFPLTFTVLNADNTPRDLTGKTVYLYVFTQEQNPTLLFSGACVLLTQSGPTLGQCTYAVQSSNFSTIGTYDAELELTIPAPPGPFSFLEDTETFTINVIPRHPTS